MLLKHLLIEIRIFFLNALHRRVQILQQIGTVLVDGEKEFGGTDPANRRQMPRVAVGVRRNIGVQLPGAQHLQSLRFCAGELRQLCLNSVKFRPAPIIIRLNAVLVDADPLAVQGGIILRRDVPIFGEDENAIFFRSHGVLWKQHRSRAFFGIGDVAHHVDPAVCQHLQQFRPASMDIGIVPSGIGRDL